MKWLFPVKNYTLDLPVGDHVGAFAARRRFDVHCGVDIYCPDGTPVYAVEDGQIISIEDYTGVKAESPWWNDTEAALVAGSSGVVCYGEIDPDVRYGQFVKKGDQIGRVKQVLKTYKGKPMSMLHFELYKPHAEESVWWHLNDPQPETLLNPTDKLLEAERH